MACLSNLSVTVGHIDILWSKYGLTTYKRKVYGDKNVSKWLFLQLNSLLDYSLHESSEVVILVSRLVSNKSLTLVLHITIMASLNNARHKQKLLLRKRNRVSELGIGNYFSARLNCADIKNECNKIHSSIFIQLANIFIRSECDRQIHNLNIFLYSSRNRLFKKQ